MRTIFLVSEKCKLQFFTNMISNVNQHVCSNITDSLAPESEWLLLIVTITDSLAPESEWGIVSDFKKIFVLFTYINFSTKAIFVSLIKKMLLEYFQVHVP